MRVRNVHQRAFSAALNEVGALLDGLASEEDRLWPRDRWPAITLDRPLQVGAVGGHGPIRYVIEEYKPGRFVRFRFTGPRGFDGAHWLEVVPSGAERVVLRHTVKMRTTGLATLSWALLYRPLHDALLEDALDSARRALGGRKRARRWTLWVRMLRAVAPR